MAELNVFTEATQKAILDELKLQNSLVKVIASGWNINDYQTVQELVRGGGGKRYFPIGTQFAVPHSAYGGGTIIFDVVDHDGYKNPADPNAHTMTLLMHDVIYGRMVDSTEALYAVNADVFPDGLPAGTYNFTLLAGYDESYGGGKTYQFTTTIVVPVGGVIMFPWSYNSQASNTKVSTYASRESTTAIESVSVSEGSSGTSLGTADGTTAHMNHSHRIRYGSNHYGESAIRQWLNSDGEANAWWEPQTEFDRPCSYTNVAGFLKGIDPDFLSVVGEVDVVTARNNIFNVDGNKGGTYTLRDKFFFASRVELGYGPENGISEGSVFALYDGATNTDRIKYDIAADTTARYWWVRSPGPSNARSVRSVTPDGSLSNLGASDGYGAAAACVIY